MQDDPGHRSDPRSPRIVVIGPCASGKTTLVDSLQEAGVDAWVVAQEHSIVRSLWSRRDPDLVVALDLSLDHVRARRSSTWTADLYRVQHERLQEAFANADLLLDSGEMSASAVLSAVLDLVADYRTSQRVIEAQE